MKARKWYQSKTILSNIVVFVATVIPVITAGLGDLLSTEQTLTVVTILGLANAVLQVFIRVFMTNSAIEKTAVTTGG